MIGILAFTSQGQKLARLMGDGLSAAGSSVDYYDRERQTAREYVASNFLRYNGFLFVGALGICVRMIAPHIRSKDLDPAVVCMDEKANFVIPVLAGHIGGANRLASQIADLAGSQAVITTATDVNGSFAADVWATELGARIEDISKIKDISGAVLAGEKIGLDPGSFPIQGQPPQEILVCQADRAGIEEESAFPRAGICTSLSGSRGTFQKTLDVIPRIVTLGIGCRRDTEPDRFEEAVLSQLEQMNLNWRCIEAICSIDLKKGEECLIRFCDKYRIPFITYTAEELMEVPGEFTPSDFVLRTTGADNVCDRSAMRFCRGGRRIMEKTTIGEGITMAAAIRDWSLEF